MNNNTETNETVVDQSLTKFNLGPGTFLNGTNFCMSSTSWLTLQTYFYNVKKLPSTIEELSSLLGPSGPSAGELENIIIEYVNLQTQGAMFTSTLYPSIVNSCSIISQYSETCIAQYGQLQLLMAELTIHGNPVQNFARLGSQIIEIIDAIRIPDLSKLESALNFIIQFNEKLNRSLHVIGSTSPTPMGTGVYAQNYEQYVLKSNPVTTVFGEFASQISVVYTDQVKSNQKVIAKGEQADYQWNQIFGITSSLIINGTPGSNGTEALQELKQLRNNLSQLSSQDQAYVLLMLNISTVTMQYDTLQSDLTTTTEMLQGTFGNWQTIRANILNFQNLINGGNPELIVNALLDIDFEKLTKDWKNLNQSVNTFTSNANIVIN